MSVINIVLIEDDEEIRNSIHLFLSKSEAFCIKGSFDCAEEFIRNFKSLEVDVVLMDVTLPGMSGIECINLMKPRRPKIIYIICTENGDYDRIFDALCAGASGYITKNLPPSRFMETIHDIMYGFSPIPAPVARVISRTFSDPAPSNPLTETLSQPEQDVLHSLKRGFKLSEITGNLMISPGDLSLCLSNILHKLQTVTRAEDFRQSLT